MGRRCLMSTISLVSIVKNESEILERMIESVRSIVDEFIIVDTGSIDNTKETIAKYGKVYWIPFENYVTTKNKALELATGDYILFMDADERVTEGLEKLKQYAESGIDAVSCPIIEGPIENEKIINMTYYRNRLWKRDLGWKFLGPGCHEVAFGPGNIIQDSSDIKVRHEHIKTNKIQLSHDQAMKYVEYLGNALKENPQDQRAVFYMARTLKDLGQFTKSIDFYNNYLTLPNNFFRDERWQAAFDIAVCWKANGEYDKAIQDCEEAIKIDPRRAEAFNLIGLIYYNLMDWGKALFYFEQASALSPPSDVVLFMNPREYLDIPLDYISICYDRLRDYGKAFDYNNKLITSLGYIDQRIINNMAWLRGKNNLNIFMTLGNTPEPVYGGMIDKIGIGGVETTYVELSAELVKQRHNVYLFSKCEHEHQYNGVYYIPFEKLGEYSHISPDVIITSRWFDPLYTFPNAKKIIWLQDAHFADPDRPDAFQIADAVICSSPWHRGYIAERFQHGIDAKKIKIIPLGIRKGLFLDTVSKNPFRCIYSSNPDRGLYELVGMWGEITDRIPEINLIITYGWEGLLTWGNNQEWIDGINSQKKWVLDKLSGFNNVSFKGRLTKKDLAQEMLSCSLCLYPNNFQETFCLTALETQAAAVPMITTDRGALATTLIHDGNVLIQHDVNTPQYQKSFIDAACDLLENQGKRKAYAQICREYAMQSKLDWTDIGESWQQMIWRLY